MEYVIKNLVPSLKKVNQISSSVWIGWLYVLILFILNFIRIFDGNFWGDEIYSILVAHKPHNEILNYIATNDVHPPLYYLILKLFLKMFGDHVWLFHGVSFLMTCVGLFFCMTCIWKRFGKQTAFLLMTFISLAPSAIVYSVEVRSYNFGLLLCMLSFYHVYLILHEGTTRNYLFFGIISLAAMYTHAYCTVAMGFLYLSLFVLSLSHIIDKRKFFITSACVAVFYSPWLVILVQKTIACAKNFWILSIPSIKECAKYVLLGEAYWPTSRYIFILAIFVLSLALFCFQTSKTNSSESSDKILHNSIFSKIKCHPDIIWILTGFVCIIGTVGTGILLSRLTRPLLYIKYIYPVSVISWMIFAFVVGNVRYRKIFTCCALCGLLILFLPHYKRVYKGGEKAKYTFYYTMDAMNQMIKPEDAFCIDSGEIEYDVRFYFPNNIYIAYKDNLLDSINSYLLNEMDYVYFIFNTNWGDLKKKEDLQRQLGKLKEAGFFYTKIIPNGNIGERYVDIYKIEPLALICK